MITDDREIVPALLLALSTAIGIERFEMWFAAGTRLSLEGDGLRVSANSQFKIDWLRKNFAAELEAAVRQVVGKPLKIEFRVDAKLAARPAPRVAATPASPAAEVQPAPAIAGSLPASQASARPVGRRFARLDEFVVGDSNRYAFESAQQFIQRPEDYSPLWLHGPTGAGKTHLLEGIWGGVRRERKLRRVVYLSAEQFTSYFLEALQGKGLPNFRRKYRELDLLIIDDVQFFLGKTATLTELQHTIDTVQRQGGQLVFGSTCQPGEMQQVGPELFARMSGGVACELRPIDHATRRTLLRRMAAQSEVAMSDELLESLAGKASGDARQLSGLVKRLKALSHAAGGPVTPAAMEAAVGDLLPVAGNLPSLRDLERVVCELFQVDPKQLKTAQKSKQVSHPRMLLMWLARKHTGSALSEIGRYFHRRSHTTVLSAEKKVNGWVEQGERLQLGARTVPVQEVIRQIEQRLHCG